MTYIYENVGKNQFHDAFIRMGRKEQFSYEGREALYDYLVEYAEASGNPIKLDVIALCCEYQEHDSIEDYNDQYGTDFLSWDKIESSGVCVIQFGNGSAITQEH
jgi:hypothetical protein